MDLESIEREIEALLEPGQRRGFFAQLWGLAQEPAAVQAEALGALLKQLTPAAAGAGTPTRGRALVPYFAAARSELAANVAVIRALAETRSHPPFAYVTWLWKISQVLRTLERDGWLEPLPASVAKGGARPKPVSWLLRLPSEPLLSPLPSGPRLQGLAFQPLLDLASRETEQLGRRRRLLEAARRLLLETSAREPMPAADVQARVLAITQQIRQINLWQAEGLEPDVDLRHQLQGAVRRRDAHAVSVLLDAFDDLARAAPVPAPLNARVAAARGRIKERFPSLAEAPTLAELSRRTFGDTAAAAIHRGSVRARAASGGLPGTEGELVRVGTAVDGSFELGRSVAPVRVVEEQRRMAEVDFPTQTMQLAPARQVRDLPNSLIDDPRLVLYDLASRSLLARRYLAQRKTRRSMNPRYTEARYYLLDGSASMGGRRARMRDAIVIAELATMIRHLEHGTATARPVVYYRYFSKGSEPLVRARTIEEASQEIENILLRQSRGETDIERALIESFAELGRERDIEPTLKRAQLVLVTDGVANIDLARVWRARENVGDIPVQVSVIALGGENPALKELAAVQRARGEAVFYHYLSDQTMYLMSRGARARGEKPEADTPQVAIAKLKASQVIAPALNETEPAPEQNFDAQLWQELDQLVDELSVLQEPPDLDGLEQVAQLEAAYDELGLSLSDTGLEAERARCEAKKRDLRALSSRFERWFPDLSERAAPKRAPPERELLEVIEVALLSVRELIAYLDGPPLQRRVDAIEILERLLLEAGVSPWAYCNALPFATAVARQAIMELRVSICARDSGTVGRAGSRAGVGT
jgi:hypothetical protein